VEVDQVELVRPLGDHPELDHVRRELILRADVQPQGSR
jgi:hypothetical protein